MKVILHKLFPYAPYLNEYIGFEMDIPDDGDPIAEVETLRKLAEKSHRERYPEIYSETGLPPIPHPANEQPKERTREEMVAAHIQTINECKTLRNLEMFRAMVERENENVLYEAYHNKKKQLQ